MCPCVSQDTVARTPKMTAAALSKLSMSVEDAHNLMVSPVHPPSNAGPPCFLTQAFMSQWDIHKNFQNIFLAHTYCIFLSCSFQLSIAGLLKLSTNPLPPHPLKLKNKKQNKTIINSDNEEASRPHAYADPGYSQPPDFADHSASVPPALTMACLRF